MQRPFMGPRNLFFSNLRGTREARSGLATAPTHHDFGALVYWSLDQDSGATETDDSGNGWDLTLESGLTW